jgi:ribosomal peptide maturation radical SAM protein 1
MKAINNSKVLLVSMPWTAISEPSLGLAILKSKLKSSGINCTVAHLNFLLLKYMRGTTYLGITNMYAFNEFLFTNLFESTVSESQLNLLRKRAQEALHYKYFDERYASVDDLVELFLKIRNEIIPQYLNECLKIVADSDATMVGFTCMFDQTFASLALAKLVKEQFPDKLIVLGGYALEGDPGEQIMKSFPFVDCICYGEGEEVIAELAKSAIDRGNFKGIPNILYRTYNHEPSYSKTLKRKGHINMDLSPFPDYDDFICDMDILKREHAIEIKWTTLPIETSRGCWWGQTNHCTFCGIDDETMQYRQRSTENTLSLLSHIHAKYNTLHFRISDYILPYSYYKTLLPVLADIEPKYVLTCELKANVSKEQFQLLLDAGFVEVQPGIESFSSGVLKKMSKGVSAIQNIYCLLLGRKMGIRINYNFLYGFPDDDINDYNEMLKTIPSLYHLDAPSSRVIVSITRFSPLQANPERFGLPEKNEQVHDEGYDIIFSDDFLKEHQFEMKNYCYHFKTSYTLSNDIRSVHDILTFQIDHWRTQQSERSVRLYYELSEEGIIFYDSRYNDKAHQFSFNYKYALVYLECCEKITNRLTLAQMFKMEMSGEEFDFIIDELARHRLIFMEGNKIIALALSKEEYEQIDAVPLTSKWKLPYV